jgi:peroxisomal membrane protein 4
MPDAASPALAAARVLALRVLFGARNGLLYGVKVRAPHAVVLTALWAGGTWADKARAAASATATHARQLGTYAALYKLLFNALALAEARLGARARPGGAGAAPRLAGLSGAGEPGAPLRAAVAGGLAGSFVFAQPTSINQQILLFLFSRAGA